MSASGRYWAMRRTISLAFTSALSPMIGVEPCAARPCTTRRVQAAPFSATSTGSFMPDGVCIGVPPHSVRT
ncbi:unannotated protein [freshwater metagenome]|uniref:Unannotated protein n=1 Tax=freshwater metagenome TaxID=449393 RepID=A0A6J6FA57_9ZZZZ